MTPRPDAQGTVLIVERDPGIADLERRYLSREGFEVRTETDPVLAPSAAREVKPDAIVLDLSAGRADAAELYRQVGAAAGQAVIVCTGDDETLRALGVNTERGLNRPFSPRALVRAVCSALRGSAEEPAPGGELVAGEVRLDLEARSVTAAGVPLTLTATEFDLLAYLASHQGRVYTREQLLSAVWGALGAAGTRTVDVHIAQLRGKLGDASPIRTVRGVGYAVDP